MNIEENQVNEIFINNNGKWERFGKIEDFKLEQESEIEYETFIPTIRKQSEEFIIPLSTKPFKIYFRTKNRRIKKKQIKKSPLLKMILELKKCVGISEVAKNVK